MCLCACVCVCLRLCVRLCSSLSGVCMSSSPKTVWLRDVVSTSSCSPINIWISPPWGTCPHTLAAQSTSTATSRYTCWNTKAWNRLKQMLRSIVFNYCPLVVKPIFRLRLMASIFSVTSGETWRNLLDSMPSCVCVLAQVIVLVFLINRNWYFYWASIH